MVNLSIISLGETISLSDNSFKECKFIQQFRMEISIFAERINVRL